MAAAMSIRMSALNALFLLNIIISFAAWSYTMHGKIK